MDTGDFAAKGFTDPQRVLTDRECRRFMRLWQQRSSPSPADWSKGNAASARLFYEIGTRPTVLGPVAAVLGEDLILWGASIVLSAPGKVHPLHTDIETSNPQGRAVSVWIGLENITRRSSLRVITRSHKFGATIQQVAHENGRRRGNYGDSEALAWAIERDSKASLVELDMSDGEAIWFDGNLWHGSDNTGRSLRTALLLQYASVDTPIRIPDVSQLEWPFRFLPAPRPPCVLVRGRSPEGVNRIVSPPVTDEATAPMLSTWIRALELPLERDAERGFKAHPIFQGSTPNVQDLSCHVSVLDPGASPHELHSHPEEEILIVLDGEADLVLEADGGAGELVERAKPGTLAYYSARRRHTIRGAGRGPVTYLMLKWGGEPRAEVEELKSSFYVYAGLEPISRRNGFRTARVFEGRTRHLGKLHCHVTTLDAGAGYEPHADAHDVVILALAGTLETGEVRVEAPAVVFYAGGQLHGMRNVGEKPARYLVFEFHRNPSDSWATDRGAVDRISRILRSKAGRFLRRFPRIRSVLRRALPRRSA